MVLVAYDGHYFIAPDNGLLPLILGSSDGYTSHLCHAYNEPYRFAQWVNDAATIAQTIAKSEPLPDSGFELQVLKPNPKPLKTSMGIECHILYTDNYGNVILNVTKDEWQQITESKPFQIRTLKGQGITAINNRYDDVATDTPLCRFNKAGFLEIAVNRGSATDMLGITAEQITTLRYDPVRVFIKAV